MELISNPLVFFGSMLRKYTSYLALIPLVFGICLAFNPYLFVPEYVVERYSVWGHQQPGAVIFTIRSKGLLTANYPVDIQVEVVVGKDIEKYFQGTQKIEILIINAYEYPTLPRSTKFIPTGSIPISVQDRKGRATVIFPYSGSFSSYVIFVNGTAVWTYNPSMQNEHALFQIESYSSRLQIENSNRNTGIGIASLSCAIISLIPRGISKRER